MIFRVAALTITVALFMGEWAIATMSVSGALLYALGSSIAHRRFYAAPQQLMLSEALDDGSRWFGWILIGCPVAVLAIKLFGKIT